MPALYELTGSFAELFEKYEEISEEEDPQMTEAWFDTLDGIEQEIQAKAEAVGIYIKNLKAEEDALKAEEEQLYLRRKAKENAVKRMKQYLIDCLESARLSKVDMPRAAISIRNNAESVNILDESKFIEWAEKSDHDDLLKYHEPEIKKTPVKALLKAGEKIPFAQLVRTKTVIIK